jgi:hypothetical protein
MLPLVERMIVESGGLVDADAGRWLLPPVPTGDPLETSPTHREWMSSATARVKAAGGIVSATSSIVGSPPPTMGVSTPSAFANGCEHDFSGAEEEDRQRTYFSSAGAIPQGEIVLTVTYDRTMTARRLRFIEGDHVTLPAMTGGWVEQPVLEARIDGVWSMPAGHWSESADSSVPFQPLDWVLDAPATVSGVRLRGIAGGTHHFVTCAELDAMDDPTTPPPTSFDLDASGTIDVGDLYAWHDTPRDLDGDGLASPSDLAMIGTAVRWRERRGMQLGR